MNIASHSMNAYISTAAGSEAMNYAAGCCSCTCCTCTCASTAVETQG